LKSSDVYYLLEYRGNRRLARPVPMEKKGGTGKEHEIIIISGILGTGFG